MHTLLLAYELLISIEKAGKIIEADLILSLAQLQQLKTHNSSLNKLGIYANSSNTGEPVKIYPKPFNHQ